MKPILSNLYLGIAILLCALVVGILVYWIATPSHDAATRRKTNMTRLQLSNFQMILGAFLITRHGDVPDTTFSDLVEVIREHSVHGKSLNEVAVYEIIDGIDPWGHEIRLQVTRLDDSTIVRFWSIGPDGIDEDGRGDDILMEARYPPSEYPRTSPN